jgi:hypothetical protein
VQKYSFFSFAQAFRRIFFQKFFSSLIDSGLQTGIFRPDAAGTANQAGFCRRIKRIKRIFGRRKEGMAGELNELFSRKNFPLSTFHFQLI